MIDAIEGKLLEELRAWQDLDPIATFARGFLPYVPRDWYPFIELFVSDERETGVMTGATATNEYKGTIQVSVRIPDKATNKVDRVVVVPSYTEVRAFVRAIRAALVRPEMQTLGELKRADGREVVMEFSIADEASITYGIESRDRRQDNYNNFGILPFRVETLESR